MNRIEEAIQKAKVAKAVREREAERAAAEQTARARGDEQAARPRPEDPSPRGRAEDAPDERSRGARIEPFPRMPSAESRSGPADARGRATDGRAEFRMPARTEARSAEARSSESASSEPRSTDARAQARADVRPVVPPLRPSDAGAPLEDTNARHAAAESGARRPPGESALRDLPAAEPAPAAPSGSGAVPPARADAGAPSTMDEANAAPALVVDAVELERVGLWPDAEHARRLADEFRVAKRAVLAQFLRQRGSTAARRVVAVTSALSGEGKSFSSLHLAISTSLERGLNVLLVDGDAARPTLTRALGCAGSPGLLDCLERGYAFESALRTTTIDRLWFLPAGSSEHGAAELLSSPQMAQLLDRAAARLRDLVVVVDTPPLLLTVEARALVDAATQTLLVVKANSTPQGAILQALDQLGDDRAVQLLLNQRQQSALDAYQYYYSYPSAAHASEPH